MNHNEEYEVDLLKLFQALVRKAWAIILAAVIFGGTFFVGSALLIKPLYKAQALMYVNSSNISVGGTKVSISQSELTAAKTLVDTYIVILKTRTTINAMIEQSGVPYTYEQIIGNEMIEASAVDGTEVFSITITSPDPKEAELMANTIAEILPEKIASIVEGSSARIVDYAVIPAGPTSPNLMKNGIIGAILGFVLASAVIIVLELMDDLVHDPDYLTQTYEIPVLAVIPDLLSSKRGNAYYQSSGQYGQKGR